MPSSINVWNQAGQESTKRIAVSANGGVTVPPQPVEPPETNHPARSWPGAITRHRHPGRPHRRLPLQLQRLRHVPVDGRGQRLGQLAGRLSPRHRHRRLRLADERSARTTRSTASIPRHTAWRSCGRGCRCSPRKGHRFVGGVAANGNVADAEATLELARDPANGLVMVEGLNEPNTNFGSGEVPPQMTKDIQDCLWRNKLPGIPVVGPSIVFGLPYPEGYITPGYCSAEDIAYPQRAHGHHRRALLSAECLRSGWRRQSRRCVR